MLSFSELKESPLNSAAREVLTAGVPTCGKINEPTGLAQLAYMFPGATPSVVVAGYMLEAVKATAFRLNNLLILYKK